MTRFVRPGTVSYGKLGDCWGQSYTYDRYANLTGMAVTKCTAPALSLTVNPSNNQITNGGYTYDAAGNVTSDGTLTYTWNAQGLLSATLPLQNHLDRGYFSPYTTS